MSATEQDITAFCKAMFASFANAPKDPEATARLWHKHLAKYDRAALIYAAEVAVEKYKFFPSLAEIVELIDDLPPAPMPSVDQLRGQAMTIADDDAPAWYRMAAAFEKAGRTSAAEHAYNKAVRIQEAQSVPVL